MPIQKSEYRAPGLFKNGHFSTIYSAKLRPAPKVKQHRERIKLRDGDFMDVDFSYAEKPSKKLAILVHGLEGNAQRTYIRGQAKSLKENGWDIAAINLRGCSGELNLAFQAYTAGKTDDLVDVLEYIFQKDKYSEIDLVGFSLGGNLILKYLGERETLPTAIKKAVAISTPVHLESSLEQLSTFNNYIYHANFLKNLKKKLRLKIEQHPEKLTALDYKKIKSLLDFDDIYTAKAHGFKNAKDYYTQNSSLQFLPNIKIPTLILNAENDSFLSPKCYPFQLAENSKNIYLETPKHGGHVGFHVTNKQYYSERRAYQFLSNNY